MDEPNISQVFDPDATIGQVDLVIGAVRLVERKIFFDEPQAEELWCTLQLALEKLQNIRTDLESAPAGIPAANEVTHG